MKNMHHNNKCCACNINESCNPEGTAIHIFTPANCRKMCALTQITGMAAPNCEIVVAIDELPEIIGFTKCSGRFEVQNCHKLKEGFHKIKVFYRDNKDNPCQGSQCKGSFDIVWVYITESYGRCKPSDVELICAKTGSEFRTIDATIKTYTKEEIRIDYLLVPPNTPCPSDEDIKCFNDCCMLANGEAARGSICINPDSEDCNNIFTFALTGRKEGEADPCEIGIIDGYCYDVYLLVCTCEQSEVIFGGTVMAMPFAGVVDSKNCIYEIRELSLIELEKYPDLLPGNSLNKSGVAETARILQNIQRVYDLYIETKGIHGAQDSLNCNYMLTSGFDLAGYAEAYCGNGWQPIGGCNCIHSCCRHKAFTGTLMGDGCDTLIKNLTIKVDCCKGFKCCGLFGACSGAVIENVSLDGVVIDFKPDNGLAGAAVGTLAGSFKGGYVRLASVKNISVYSQGDASNNTLINTGGLIGESYKTCIDQSFTTGQIVSSGPNVGGLVGFASDYTKICNSYSTALVSGNGAENMCIGGLLGLGVCCTSIENSFYSGSVLMGTNSSAGIAGCMADSFIESSLNLGNSVEASSGTVHRILGTEGGALSNNYALGTISLMLAGVGQVPIDDPNNLDGGSIELSEVPTVTGTWDITNIWDMSNLTTLGIPVLKNNPPSCEV